jgi:DNA-binding response OmpR family regulator
MTTKPKILLVDDEQAITANLSPFLERSGFILTVAADGEAALAQVPSFAPDLIVLDILMPRLDGRETLRRLRQAGDWTPVILLTQVGESTERAMALEEGADDYLNKPFDPHELVARMRAVLRRARAGQPPLDAVWGWDYPTGTRTVDTRIAELRRVLDDDPASPRYVETVPGQGYRFVGEVEAAQ